MWSKWWRLGALVGFQLLGIGRVWAQSGDGMFVTLLSAPGKLEIVRRPRAADYRFLGGGVRLAALPRYTPGSQDPWQVDLRSKDLSHLDVSGRLLDLLQATFDSKTVWPKELPPGFDMQRTMDLGRNPGLGIRSLHEQGITGKGVGLAIIDQALLVDHVEYKDRLRLYEEIHWQRGSSAQMHGPAVASIAVGGTVGVAPGADLYYIAEWHGRTKAGVEFEFELTPLAQAVDRIVEIDRGLPREKRIRVISISLGINPTMEGYALAKEAIDRARRAGIETVYVGSSVFMGLGRDPMADADAPDSYVPGQYWSRWWKQPVKAVMVPMDARCTAAPNGVKDYAFYRSGGMSWAVPWLAGLYVLACEVRPDITWEIFWNGVQTTCDDAKAVLDGSEQVFGRIVNPIRLLAALR